MEPDYIDINEGRITLVTLVETETATAYGKYANGVDVNFIVNNGGSLPEAGNVILLSNNGWKQLPNKLWKSSKSIGVVRHILNEAEILVEDRIEMQIIANPNRVQVKLHNTIEFDKEIGVLRVIYGTPISPQDFGLEICDIVNEYLVDTSQKNLTFEDFGGFPDIITRAKELIENQINNRDILIKIGARPLKGILLTGPPGTGKTFLARIIAQEINADFYLISGPSIISKWLGDSESALRKIFEAATADNNKNAIIFIDEIDSIAERRSADSHEASRRLVAQLLTLMDGFDEKNKNVIVIAATNRADSIDPALLRPGRFDCEIEFGLPTIEDRLAILKSGGKLIKKAEYLPLEDIAGLTEGWSSAELSSLWTEAALIASADQRESIHSEDMSLAYERIAARPKRQLKDSKNEARK